MIGVLPVLQIQIKNMNEFNNFYDKLKKHIPSLQIKFKDESWLMKLISNILFFNKDFKTNFITTIGSTVYFPSRQYLEDRKSFNSIVIMAHEFVHASDSNKMGSLIFSFFYLFPQSLSIFSLLLLPFCWYLSIILFLFLLLPMPAFWRKKFELRGYKMSLFAMNELYKKNNLDENERKLKLEQSVDILNKNFITSAYYFMWPFGVKKELSETVYRILSGDIFKDDIVYSHVYKALKQQEQTTL